MSNVRGAIRMSEISAADRLAGMLRGAEHVPPAVRRFAELAVELGEMPVLADLAGGVGLADSLTVLARVKHLLDAEIARRTRAAQIADVLPTTARTTLQNECTWSGPAADSMVTAARFAHNHPPLMELWQCGRVSVEAVAAIARGTRALAPHQVEQVVKALLPSLPRLSLRHLKMAVNRAVDLLRPDDRDAAEQRDHDRRYLVFADLNGVTTINGQVPALEGAAIQAALNAVAESLRTEGDGLTRGQRRADALVTLINAAAAHGDVPASTSGLPVGATITLGIHEAERVAAGHARATGVDLTDLVTTANAPGALGTTPTSAATLGDAATRFALCHGTLTGALLDDRAVVGGPISDALVGAPAVPLAVGRDTRLATKAQRIALALRDGGCLLCQRPAAECQTHHVTPWSEGGGTDLDNMCLLCWSHHRQVDLGRWLLIRTQNPGPGDPYWTVEATPRHRWRRRVA